MLPPGFDEGLAQRYRIQRELGWEPSISLRDGLERTYAWIEPQVAALTPAL